MTSPPHTTETVPAPARRRFWQDLIANAYFPLDLRFRGGEGAFHGELGVWRLGELSLSRHVSDAASYRRCARHIVGEREESFLITVPERGEVRFTQDGKDVRCRAGAFVVERSHSPYEFSHEQPSALWVLKAPCALLKLRLDRPEKLAQIQFEADRGAGALFVETLKLTTARIGELDADARALMGRQLLDLASLAVGGGDPASGGSTVRAAHLRRCERFIEAHLSDPGLGPQAVADASGVSLRYVHRLFENEGVTVCAYIRKRRLAACDAALRDPTGGKTLSEIAYAFGFGDQAQFSRQYRAQFGMTPSQARALCAR